MSDYAVSIDRLGSGWCVVSNPRINGILMVRYGRPDESGRIPIETVIYDCTPNRLGHRRHAPVNGANLRRWNLALIEATINDFAELPPRDDSKPSAAEQSVIERYGADRLDYLDPTFTILKVAGPKTQFRVEFGTGDGLPPRFRLGSRPDGRITDTYLQDVATAYADAVRRGDKSPAKTLATDSGANQRTVQGWVAKCRDRGYLPRGRQGSAG